MTTYVRFNAQGKPTGFFGERHPAIPAGVVAVADDLAAQYHREQMTHHRDAAGQWVPDPHPLDPDIRFRAMARQEKLPPLVLTSNASGAILTYGGPGVTELAMLAVIGAHAQGAPANWSVTVTARDAQGAATPVTLTAAQVRGLLADLVGGHAAHETARNTLHATVSTLENTPLRAAMTPYAKDAQVRFSLDDPLVYRAAKAGTSGSEAVVSGPASVTDGGVTWVRVGNILDLIDGA